MNEQISQFLRERIDAGDFPSAVYLVAEKGRIVFQDALGFAVVEPQRIEAAVDTIFDLASLTKPLVTGLLIAKLIELGEIQLDARVAIYLKEFETEGKRMITVSDLLTHTSHLPAWKPFYLSVADPSEVIRDIGTLPLNYAQAAVTYSDIGFIALGCIIERFLGKNLDGAAKDIIFTPLDLTDTSFNPGHELKPRIAASEKGREFEKQAAAEQGFEVMAGANGSDILTSATIWGEVHDGNARFMGGVAGHAGLFSTVEDTYKLALQFLPGSTTILKVETCELFQNNLTAGMNEDRSIAFQLASTAESAAGTKISPESFGHLGFTGTSLWIDPAEDRIFILLTNRTHLKHAPFVNINSVRRRFHDLAVECLK